MADVLPDSIFVALRRFLNPIFVAVFRCTFTLQNTLHLIHYVMQVSLRYFVALPCCPVCAQGSVEAQRRNVPRWKLLHGGEHAETQGLERS